MTRAWLFAVALLPFALNAQAASDPRAPMPERPTVATNVWTMPRGYLELETGIESDFNQDHTHSWIAPVFVKLGLSSRSQVSASVNLLAPGGGSAGVGDVSVGIKYRLAEKLPLVGAFAILPTIKFPTGNASHGTTTTDESIGLISSHKSGIATLDIELGYTHRSGDGSHAPANATLWAFAGGLAVTERVTFALEISGLPRTTGPSGTPASAALLAGPSIVIGPRSVLDFGGILNFHGSQPTAFFIGLSRNLGKF